MFIQALVGLALVQGFSLALLSIDDHEDSGRCVGEITKGNSPFLPELYHLYFDLDAEEEKFKGNVMIEGTLRDDVDWFILHSVRLSVSSVKLNGTKLDEVPVMDNGTNGARDWPQLEGGKWYLNTDVGFLNISVPREKKESHGEKNYLAVSVEYEGVFDNDKGLIKRIYSKTDKSRWMIFTHLEPIHARSVFPCVDLPKYKARFDITIKDNFPNRTVLSNMPRKNTSDKNYYTFETTQLMSTYLVSFLVCDYMPLWSGSDADKIEGNITMWVPYERKRSWNLKFTLSSAHHLRRYLEEYMGSKYSLPKLDMFTVDVKDGIGGMENWGLIMFQKDSLLEPKYVNGRDLSRVIFTLTHEMAHHWFGNSVTVADWCGMWYQEAIPTFIQGRISNKYHKYDIDVESALKWSARKQIMDGECAFSKYAQPLRNKEDPMGSEIFTQSHYLKGANLLFMVESLVTPDVFQKALQNFHAKYIHSYATEEKLWEEVENAVGEGGIKGKLNALTKLSTIMNTWVTQRSHPIVMVKRDSDGRLSLKQRVCIMGRSLPGQWLIPISYTTSKDPNFVNTKPRTWMRRQLSPDFQNMNVTLKDDEWIILNLLGTGVYRVQYDDITWKLLIKQLKKDAAGDPKKAVIPELNRAMLVGDSFFTAQMPVNGKPWSQDWVRIFEMLDYARDETGPLVWDALRSNIKMFTPLFPKKMQDKFQKYVQFLVKPAFDRATSLKAWEQARVFVEKTFVRAMREPVFALAWDIKLPGVQNFSRDVALRIINNPSPRSFNESWIPPEIRFNVWCAAISTEIPKIFDYALKLYHNNTDQEEIFKSLWCSKTHATQLLQMILENNVLKSKANFKADVLEFIVGHWQDECKAILSFIEKYRDNIIDNENELEEFKDYVKNAPTDCIEKTQKIFGNTTDPTDEKEHVYRDDTAGGPPLQWLLDHEHDWKI